MLDDIWREVRERLLADVQGLSAPLPDTAADKTQRYVVASCLQKAIRVGDRALAQRMAVTLLRIGGAWYCLWRLGVIAVEDVSVADPVLVAGVLAAGVDPNLREAAGEERLIAYLAGRLAESAKCRLVCDLYVGRDPRWIGTMTGDLTPVEQLATSLSRKTWEGGWFAIAAAIVRADPPTTVEAEPDLTMIGDYLSAAYDMHTGQIGARLASYVRKANAAVARFFGQRPELEATRQRIMGEAIWHAEYAPDRRLTSREIELAADAGLRGALQPLGISPADFRALVGLVRSDRDLLHRARRRILQSMAEEAVNKAAQQVLDLHPPTPQSDTGNTA